MGRRFGGGRGVVDDEVFLEHIIAEMILKDE